jgi:hypothetical protein
VFGALLIKRNFRNNSASQILKHRLHTCLNVGTGLLGAILYLFLYFVALDYLRLSKLSDRFDITCSADIDKFET